MRDAEKSALSLRNRLRELTVVRDTHITSDRNILPIDRMTDERLQINWIHGIGGGGVRIILISVLLLSKTKHRPVGHPERPLTDLRPSIIDRSKTAILHLLNVFKSAAKRTMRIRRRPDPISDPSTIMGGITERQLDLSAVNPNTGIRCSQKVVLHRLMAPSIITRIIHRIQSEGVSAGSLARRSASRNSKVLDVRQTCRECPSKWELSSLDSAPKRSDIARSEVNTSRSIRSGGLAGRACALLAITGRLGLGIRHFI